MNQQQQEIEELKEEITRLKEIVEPDGNVVNNYNLTRSERLSNFLRKRWKLLVDAEVLIRAKICIADLEFMLFPVGLSRHFKVDGVAELHAALALIEVWIVQVVSIRK